MEINSFFLDLIPYLIPLLMIGIGSALNIESFQNLITNSKSSFVGFLIQVTLLPIFGIVTSLFIDNKSIAIGIIVIMCAPGGHVSSMYSSLMKGNVALTTSLTIITQLIAFVTIPFWINVASIFNKQLGVQIQIDSTELLIQLLYLVLIPVIIGMVLNYSFPKQALIAQPAIKKLFTIVTLIIAIGVPIELSDIIFDIFQTSSIFVILNLLLIFLGINFISKIANINDEDRKGIIAEGTLQNLPVAAAVASLLEINIIILVALNYFLISSFLIGIYAIYKSREY
ncbi:bile acid:sodium symporter [Candidatus Actinomarina]|nr:bile acid:sodium symporter [Candidatus Actinomarina sp.]